MELTGKVALITGAARGIGFAIAERFSEAGAQVALFDLDGRGVRDAAAAVGMAAPALAIQGDVSSEADVTAAFDQTAERFGPVGVLVNNAAIVKSGRVGELASEDWDRQLAVNLKGYFLFSKQMIRQMKGRGGAIINVASVHAIVSYAGNSAYDAAKAGILAFTRATALEYGKDGIRANAICPGYIKTPMLDDWLSQLPNAEETIRGLEKMHPLGRIGTPRDVANAALFLASDQAAWISGATLIVDGGLIVTGH